MKTFRSKKDFIVKSTTVVIFEGQLFMVEEIYNLPMPEGHIGERARNDFWEEIQ